MELYQQMILSGLERGEIQLILRKETERWLEGECYRAIQKIQAILADDGLEDPECFMKIEEIVQSLEEIGINCGNRHDFG